MGFKNTGFPMPTFNPLGFRTSGSLLKQLVKCGLKVYNTPEDDKLNKGDREPQLSQTIIGDGATYSNIGIIPNSTTKIKKLRGNFTTPNGNFEIPIGARTVSNRFLIARDNPLGRIVFGYGDAQVTTSVIADLQVHEYSTDGAKLYYDGNEIADLTGETITSITDYLFLTALNFGGPSNISNFNVIELEIDHNGETYTLDTTSRDTNGVWVLKKPSGNIQVQQFLSPPIPTEDNLLVESDYDKYGGSVSKALGKNKMDLSKLENGQIDSDGTPSGSSTRVRDSEFIIIENINTHNFKSFVQVGGKNLKLVAMHYYLKDETFISRDILQSSDTNFNPPQSTYWIKGSYAYTDDSAIDVSELTLAELQIEEGMTPTAYEPYNGYTYDALGTLPVPQGTLMSANAQGKLSTYANGVLSTPDSTGSVKIKNRVVDGVVDNLFGIAGCEVEIVNIGGFDYYKMFNANNSQLDSVPMATTVEFKELTQYTFKIEGYENLDTNNLRLQVYYTDATAVPMFSFTEIESVQYFTSDITKTIQSIGYRYSSPTNAETYIKKSTFKCYEGATYPSPEPTSGSLEDGNSIIREHLYYDASYEPSFFYTLGVPNVIPYDTMPNIVSNQIYVSEDKQKILTFEAPLTGDCDHKARRFVDINEQYFVQTSEGSGEYEEFLVDGQPLWVLKEGTNVQ